MYIPDFKYIIKVIKMDFKEEIPGGIIDFIIRGVKLQSITTALL